METDHNRILETDVLEPADAVSQPAAPVVVVQYRSRGVPVWALLLLVVVITLGTLVLYHRFFVERYRTQAARNQQVIENLVAERQLPPPLAETKRPVGGLAWNTQPVPDSSPLLAPTTGAALPPPAQAALAGPSRKDTTGNSEKANVVAPATKPADAPKPAEDPARAVAENRPAISDVRSSPTASKPLRLVEPPFRIDALDDPVDSPPAGGTAKPGPGTEKPAKKEATPPKAAPAGNHGENALAAAKTEPLVQPRAAAPPARPALPNADQFMREVEEEAAQKAADRDHINATKQAEVQTHRDEERRKFREELREALRNPPEEAAPEIDKLASRYGYDTDAVRMRVAHTIWLKRLPLTSKVKLIRSLGLPDTVILNFLSDDMRLRIRTRGGPRSLSEARVMAAMKLLSVEPPAQDANDPAGGGVPGSPTQRVGGNQGAH
jgi:hypothetical protein